MIDKEKERQEMACILSRECKSGCATCSLLSEYGCDEYDSAKKLQENGYGNIKEILQTLYNEIDRETVAGSLYDDFNYGLKIALYKIENFAEEYGFEIIE